MNSMAQQVEMLHSQHARQQIAGEPTTATERRMTVEHDDLMEEDHEASVSGTSAGVGDESEASEWDVRQVKSWLEDIGMSTYSHVFEREQVDGGRLVKLTEADLLEDDSPLNLFVALQDPGSSQEMSTTVTVYAAKAKRDARIIVRELGKLLDNEYEDVFEDSLTPDDLLEFSRRLNVFLDKWTKIEFIKEFTEDHDNRLPTPEDLEEELDVPFQRAQNLIATYLLRDKEEETDLDNLFEGYDIGRDGVVWWSVILGKLQQQQADALWSILQYLAREVPTPVMVRLMEHFRFEMTRFESDDIDRVCQGIVFGAKFPICTCIRLAAYLRERADADLSRSAEFYKLSDDYANLAVHILNDVTDSDHLATIMLEVPSDIQGKSAIQLALEHRVITFVANKRVERISNSVFRQWRFLDPVNLDKSFKSRPFSALEVLELMGKESFYFTPLGKFTTEIFLFAVYLIFFTILTHERWNVYYPVTGVEVIFWIANMGYVLFEAWDMYSSGFVNYIQEWTNLFDSAIVIGFLMMMLLRIKTFIPGLSNGCPHTRDTPVRSVNEKCSRDGPENLVFLFAWGINCVLLWLRLARIYFLSRDVAPFLRILGRMVTDLWAFFRVFALAMIGFLFCLVFVVGAPGELNIFRSEGRTLITLWRAGLGEFLWEDVDTLDPQNAPAADLNFGSWRSRFVETMIFTWMLISAVILLNLLIAMMAKTFDEITEDTDREVTFSVVRLTFELDNSTAAMPPPLNLFVFNVWILFIIVDFFVVMCTGRFIPLAVFTPNWLRRERYNNEAAVELYENERDKTRSVEESFNRFTSTFKTLFTGDNKYSGDFRWVCHFCKQKTAAESKYDPVAVLGPMLGIDKRDVKTVRYFQPLLCAHCYRTRSPLSRYKFVLEMMSYYVYQYFARYFILILVWPTAMAEWYFTTEAKKQLSSAYDLDTSTFVQDMECQYSPQVVKLLPRVKDIRSLFQNNIIWPIVKKTQSDVTPKTLRQIVDRKILALSRDIEYEQAKFYTSMCNKDKVVERMGKIAWTKLRPFALRYFRCVQKFSEENIQLCTTRVFPFSTKIIRNIIEAGERERYEENEELDLENFDINNLTRAEIRPYLVHLGVTDDEEQSKLMDSVEHWKITSARMGRDLYKKYGSHQSFYERFLFFLDEARRLTLRVRRLENMIRDVNDAIRVHGEDGRLILNQFHLVFEDIQHDAIAIALFRAIDPVNTSIPYRRVRNFLSALKQMRRNCDRALLNNNRFTLLRKGEFVRLVMKRAKRRDESSDSDSDVDFEKAEAKLENADAGRKKYRRRLQRQCLRIYKKIQEQNVLKISLELVLQFVNSLGLDLNDPDIVRFMRTRLGFFINNRGDRGAIDPLEFTQFEDLCDLDDDDVKAEDWDLDDQPQFVDIREVWDSLNAIYGIIEDRERPYLTAAAAYNILLILDSILAKVPLEVIKRSRDMEIQRDGFMKMLETRLGATTDNDYKKRYSQWSPVARQAASIFKQVSDLERHHVTFGQVRETLTFFYSSVHRLASVHRIKKKLRYKADPNRNPLFDQSVNEDMFWRFLVEEVGVLDEGRVVRAARFGKKSGDSQNVLKQAAQKRKDIASGIFHQVFDQNIKWITLRQIQVYVAWFTRRLQKIQWDGLRANTRYTFTEFQQYYSSNVVGDADGDGEEDFVDELETYELEMRRMSTAENSRPNTRFHAQMRWLFNERNKDDPVDDELCGGEFLTSFITPFLLGELIQTVEVDIEHLTGNHLVFAEEFEQFKSVLKCRGETAISMFNQIRDVTAGTVSWDQIIRYIEFLEEQRDRIESAITEEEKGEDEDPTAEELKGLMKIKKDAFAEWLFAATAARHQHVVTWVEVREYLMDWQETRDEVQIYFEHRDEKTNLEQRSFDMIEEVHENIKNMSEEQTQFNNEYREQNKTDVTLLPRSSIDLSDDGDDGDDDDDDDDDDRDEVKPARHPLSQLGQSVGALKIPRKFRS